MPATHAALSAGSTGKAVANILKAGLVKNSTVVTLISVSAALTKELR